MIDWSGFSGAVLLIGGTHQEREEIANGIASLGMDGLLKFFILTGYEEERMKPEARKLLELGMFREKLTVINTTLKYRSNNYIGIVFDDYRSLPAYSTLDLEDCFEVDKEMPRYDDFGLIISIDSEAGRDNPLVVNIEPDIELIQKLIIETLGAY